MSNPYGKIAFYPGCALDGLGKTYEVSLKLVAQDLGIPLDRIEDYNCCGALEVKNVNTMAGLLLPARNLSLAREMGADAVVSACPGCHYSLSRAQYYMSKYPKVREKANNYLEKMGTVKYDLKLMLIHAVEYVYNTVGIEGVKAKVKRPLTGLKVAPYYGCLYSRPKQYLLTGMAPLKDDPERPFFMDEILKAIGAEVVPFEAKTMCCGGPHVYSDVEVAMHLEARILKEARRNGAEVLVTDCPLGHVAIETNMRKIAEKYGKDLEMPLAYFSQLLAFAFGHSPEETLLVANITNPMSVLKRYM
ncbi:CoB--CoM heterodisulfide reductase iron-sulfur subunit B family protein [Sulfolobus acidocaldarius]|uniref:Heterodisulfide reductase B n=4 Tax=Sulfolobus acidocaldarius TaxID=2285 RepID=Q4JBT8_SULAC|nr:CoB--CoM heterodisulfide reductase iron-sulfur subunit B family protein [Sulfolobus acidocaldarius]AAY79741.1 heterodisulfide reductase B [Sulfolobus acidocaldarius DSM 639]AGE70300.1 CoB--CoM heterodisulfide reductase [Sulfolobus acidocaldarius N8]AGE72575.1 CoB--CoM heterodisulfide reductase [Sulfolobus acidocaldarius Ron12/I]ALU29299.1 disulfide reductase [Sulfolobus acidocaldarius]ALU32028.1 disulfide reductase [Sulfolobus acidocaldarius]